MLREHTCLISISANDSGKATGARNLVGIPFVGSIFILKIELLCNQIEYEISPKKSNSILISFIFLMI